MGINKARPAFALVVSALGLSGCGSEDGDGNPFESAGSAATLTAGSSATASGTATDGTSAGTDSAGGTSAGTTDPSGTGASAATTDTDSASGSAGTTDSGGTGVSSDSTSGGGGSTSGGGGSTGAVSTTGGSTSGGSTGGVSTSGSSTSGGVKFDVGGALDLPPVGTTGGGNEAGCKYLDLLFVVDISGSMKEEKANLAANFPNFVQVLDDYVNDPNTGAIGYRLGVTNSSFQANMSTTGLDGSLYGANNICGTGTDPWLDGPAPNIATNFTCLADDPKACTNSCSDYGKERPLDAIEYFTAKNAMGQPNEGFYRGKDSLLVIVMLTDEDDDAQESTTTPAQTKAVLDGFAMGEERYVIVTIAGPANMGCQSAFGSATATPILSSFTDLVVNGTKGDICLGDLAQPLEDALDLITFSCDELPIPQ